MTSSNRPRVCFGYKTALQILRAAHPCTLTLAKREARAIPQQAPSKPEFETALRILETTYPDLTIEKPVHFLVESQSRGLVSRDRKAHVCTAKPTGPSFYLLGDYAAVSAPAFAFTQMAMECSSMVSLALLGWEMCGTYRSKRTCATSAYQVPPLASVSELEDFARRNASINGARKALRTLRYVIDGSASPRETQQALAFLLPKAYGGYGLGTMHMNYEVKASKEARAISGKNSFRCDLCWPETMLGVEYQSREKHSGEASRIEDSRRANALSAMGWTVIAVTNDELDSLTATDTIAHAIGKHLGKRSRVRVENYRERKIKLRLQLGLPIEPW